MITMDLPRIAARMRIPVSRLFGATVLGVLLTTGHAWAYGGVGDLAFSVVAFMLVTVCTLGRLWCLAFISGRKGHELVTVGPYACTRNPLYVFSLIGAVGLSVASRNPLILAMVVTFFAVYYPAVIIDEERSLRRTHGESFMEYCRSVPRFLPRLSAYREPRAYTVEVATYRRTFFDAMWFMWGLLLLEVIERLKAEGIMPVMLQVP